MNPANGAAGVRVIDVEYVERESGALGATVYVPEGEAVERPRPLLVEIHGGAWCLGDRRADEILNESLARRGIVVVALDFRMQPVAGYPASLADVNQGIRWAKAHAEEFGSDPGRVGVMGTSSGAHQAMLSAMRPHHPRYSELAAGAPAPDPDASVAFAVLCWPVIDPLGRYEYARKLGEAGEPAFAETVMPLHDRYWGTVENMAEGSPLRILERGDPVSLPPVLYLQGELDRAHPRAHLERFVAAYREAGGELTLRIFEGEEFGFLPTDPVAYGLDPAAWRPNGPPDYPGVDVIADFVQAGE